MNQPDSPAEKKRFKLEIPDAFYLLFAFGASGILVFIYLLDWSASLSSPFSVNFEGPMLWAAEALSLGNNIYVSSQASAPPWVCTIYPPLYPAFCALLVKCFGVHYFALRAANMAFAAGLALVFYRILSLSGLSRLSIVASLVFLFSFNVFALYSFEARPDMMLLFFTACALERFVKYQQLSAESNSGSQQISWFSAGAVRSQALFFSFLAICVKQQAVVLVLSLVLYMLGERRWKEMIYYLFNLLFWLSILSLGMQINSQFGFFENLFFIASLKSDSNVFIANLGSLGLDWIKLVFALVLVPAALFFMKKITGINRLPFILLFVSTVLFFYSMGIPASSANHMMTAILALAWCLSIALTRLPRPWTFLLICSCLFSYPTLAEEGLLRPKLLPFAKADAEILQELNLNGKEVLTDDLYLNYLTKSKVVLVDCASFLNVWAQSENGAKDLIAAIEQKRFAAIIINENDSALREPKAWWPKPVVESIQRKYRKHMELHCSPWTMDLYLPIK